MEVNVNWMDPVWRDWLLTWPLLLFFFAIGQELRQELSHTPEKKHLLAPVSAALGGMLVPAGFYLIFSLFTPAPRTAWGIPMATDLPLALIALSAFPQITQKRIRIFLISLAIADDIGSILALGLVTSAHGGVHPTILGATLGFIWGKRGHRWTKIAANFVALPVFIVAAFSVSFDFSLHALTQPIVWQLIVARVVGKPVGIICGAFIGYALLKISHEHTLRLKIQDLYLIGTIASLGLSVALIFANVGVSDLRQQVLAITAIVLTIPFAIISIAVARFVLGRRVSTTS